MVNLCRVLLSYLSKELGQSPCDESCSTRKINHLFDLCTSSPRDHISLQQPFHMNSILLVKAKGFCCWQIQQRLFLRRQLLNLIDSLCIAAGSFNCLIALFIFMQLLSHILTNAIPRVYTGISLLSFRYSHSVMNISRLN